MPEYYNKQGAAITMKEWMDLFHDDDYKRVAAVNINGVRVSTVWLGLDHQYGIGPPLIFETLIIDGDHDGDMWRYSSLSEAMVGHSRAVELVTKERKTDG